MSAKIAQEPVSVGITLNAKLNAAPQPTSRPVESSAPSSSDTKGGSSFGRQGADAKAQPSDRPPGKDPSIAPQTLFDAALISAEFKPVTSAAERKEQVSEQETEEANSPEASDAFQQTSDPDETLVAAPEPTQTASEVESQAPDIVVDSAA